MDAATSSTASRCNVADENRRSQKPKPPARPAAPRRPRAAPINCHECGKRVLLAERVAVGALSLHKECFFCAKCGIELTATSCRTVKGQFYCEKHHKSRSDASDHHDKAPVEKTTSSKQHKRLRRVGGTSNSIVTPDTPPPLRPPTPDAICNERQSSRAEKNEIQQATEKESTPSDAGSNSVSSTLTYPGKLASNKRGSYISTAAASGPGRASPIYGPRRDGCSLPDKSNRASRFVTQSREQIAELAVDGSTRTAAPASPTSQQPTSSSKADKTSDSQPQKPQVASASVAKRPAPSRKPPAPQPGLSKPATADKHPKKQAPKPPRVPAPPPPADGPRPTAGNVREQPAVRTVSQEKGDVVYATTTSSNKSHGKKYLPPPDPVLYQQSWAATTAVPAKGPHKRPTDLPISGPKPKKVHKPAKPPGAAPTKPAPAPEPKTDQVAAKGEQDVENFLKPKTFALEVPYQESYIADRPRTRTASQSASSHQASRKRPGSRTARQEIIYQRQKRRAPSIPKDMQRWLGARVLRDDQFSLSDIENRMEQLSGQLRDLELHGQRLEEKLRNGAPNEERLMKEWLRLVEEKNQLIAKEAELVYMQQDMELIRKRDDLEAEIRRRMEIEPSRKTQRQLVEEDGLILQLVETVNVRNRLVNMLDLERLV